MNNKFLVLGFVIVVFIFGGLLYVYNPTPSEYNNPKSEDEIMCTADAMLCPDGSYVGRSGPDCKFICPQENGETEATSTNLEKLQSN